MIQNAEEAAELKKKRTFRKFSYRGVDLDQYVANPPPCSADAIQSLPTPPTHSASSHRAPLFHPSRTHQTAAQRQAWKD